MEYFFRNSIGVRQRRINRNLPRQSDNAKRVQHFNNGSFMLAWNTLTEVEM